MTTGLVVALVVAVAVAAAIAVTAAALSLAAEVQALAWPDEEPLHLRDNRAHDLELTHLARLLGAADATALHREVVSVVDRLLATTAVLAGPAGIDPRSALPDAVRRFLDQPPLGSPDRYRRDLAAVLDLLEAL